MIPYWIDKRSKSIYLTNIFVKSINQLISIDGLLLTLLFPFDILKYYNRTSKLLLWISSYLGIPNNEHMI